MGDSERLRASDVVEYLRRVASLLRDPFDILRNNYVIGQRLRIDRSLRRTMKALEVEQYGGFLPQVESLAMQGLRRLDASNPFPAGTLGGCYREWMHSHGFVAEGLIQSVETMVDAGFPIIAYYNAFGHDLSHVLTGVETDIHGEYFLQGVLNGTPFPTLNNVFYRRWIPLSVLWSARFGGLRSIRSSYRAFRAGEAIAAERRVGGIASPLTVHWLDRPLVEARRAFNVPHGLSYSASSTTSVPLSSSLAVNP